MPTKRTTVTRQPWAKQQGETDAAYEAFRVYLDLEPKKRTLDTVYFIHKGIKKPATQRYKTWSKTHRWKQRADAYDQRVNTALDDRVNEIVTRETPNVARDVHRLRDRLLTQASALLDQTDKMLQFPLAKQEVTRYDDDGKPVNVVVMPVGWNAGDIPRYMIAAKSLMEYLSVLDPNSGSDDSRRELARALVSNPRALEAFNQVKELVNEQTIEDDEA